MHALKSLLSMKSGSLYIMQSEAEPKVNRKGLSGMLRLSATTLIENNKEVARSSVRHKCTGRFIESTVAIGDVERY